MMNWKYNSKYMAKRLLLFCKQYMYLSIVKQLSSTNTLLFIAFSVLFELFKCTEEFLSKFLKLLNISETTVHFWDWHTFLSFLTKLPYLKSSSPSSSPSFAFYLPFSLPEQWPKKSNLLDCSVRLLRSSRFYFSQQASMQIPDNLKGVAWRGRFT